MTESQRTPTATTPGQPSPPGQNSKPRRNGKPARKQQVPGKMSHRQILQALTGLLAALFTAMLSATIVANALPTIMADLHGTQTDFAWVVTAALLANAVSTPIWGKLADLFSKKLLVQLSIIIFVIGSVVAGFADNMPVLLTARVIQGIGMGGLTALVQAVIGSIIPPRERGRYSGYMGAVMAVATAGGPLLGGFIVDSPLGWRWTFFLCVPLAVIALFLLQVTLRLPHTRRKVGIDWLGSILLTAGVSLLLIWVSFAGKAGYYEWMSWQTAAMVGTSIILLALLVFVESKVREPIIPLKIIRERTTALAIVASVSVGIAMFGSTTFLGQYFQIARGFSPTEAGLLMLPMIAGNLMGSVGSGQLISRFGKWKRFLIAGTIMVMAGTGLAGTLDHETDMLLVSLYIFVLGLGMGLLMQNLVLAVQNTVKVSEVGSASASIAFFRTVGGAVGVSVLGAVMSSSVTSRAADGMRAANIPVTEGGTGDSLDIAGLPDAVQGIFRAAYGDATATIFQIAAVISVVALIAVLCIKEQVLRRTLDIQPTGKMPVEPGLAGGSEMMHSGAMSTVPAAGTSSSGPDDDGGRTSGMASSGRGK
ncbi:MULTISPECIES: MDR family MFS transporter [unclassified Arthrobacter]|uniref:MDR family MFS transporter n=1 Tax=unclassified Arthrobacter TaxID=235627 RepID=UPI002F40162E